MNGNKLSVEIISDHVMHRLPTVSQNYSFIASNWNLTYFCDLTAYWTVAQSDWLL